MIQLSSDPTFHYQILRALGLASYGGADIGEVLATADQIKAGDFESFYTAFHNRAERVVAQVQQMSNAVSIRDALFRASTYFRLADLYIHGNWDDPRILQVWEKQTECFDRAMSLLPTPGERKTLTSPAGFQIPIIVFPAGPEPGEKRPTIIMCSGLDGSMEEMYHVHGIAALQRGYNVVCFEGPGQVFTRRSQGLGFILEWEQVVSPVLDHLETLSWADTAKVALLGYSLCGLLGARAAAFEPRLAALFCVDGMYDLAQTPIFPVAAAVVQQRLAAADGAGAASIQALMQDPHVPTTLRWALSHCRWAFNVRSPVELLEKLRRFTIADVVGQIRCPVLVCDAVEDHFAKGQAKMVADALGEKATHMVFTTDDAAEQHCHLGAARFCNQVIYDWFEKTILKK
ncbi:uncharacterized protein PV07_08965 [Cladophialophora immunda]|uniref:AB hydrolase-1 domain-containing protein n=1 Tax=Cladophialophora immunda TaxID=569365 RepID=A0A0D2ALB2_9EURO|nr:uncharacterized protein PV07_08965 [Cladophialophora immunda]KIW25822.1 hypothetical protein PV07_08965 [Cladophialophora immunda]OQU96176.1 hypothetical protein CLAIMM_02290 [Cladophialophora immunda]